MLKLLFILSLFILSLSLFGLNEIMHMPLLVLGIIATTLIFASNFTKFADVQLKMLATIKYIIWLIKEIFNSSMAVTLKIWQPEIQIKPGFKIIKVNCQSELAKIVYANSITLTPGTITTELYVHGYLIHALDISLIDDLVGGDNGGAMENNIMKFIQ